MDTSLVYGMHSPPFVLQRKVSSVYGYPLKSNDVNRINFHIFDYCKQNSHNNYRVIGIMNEYDCINYRDFFWLIL